MEESHSYYDFQNIINTSNKLSNERMDLLEIYLRQVLKDNTEFRNNIKNVKQQIKESSNYIDWYFRLPFYKLFWYKICNKNIKLIYLKQKENGDL